jgi:demethoxyubiquinone hydroxylase (CLK1/Coq7/Cat5 family)
MYKRLGVEPKVGKSFALLPTSSIGEKTKKLVDSQVENVINKHFPKSSEEAAINSVIAELREKIKEFYKTQCGQAIIK